MTIDVNAFYTPERFARFKEFASTKETPFVVIDTEIIDEAYTEITNGFPVADIFYAIKANPAPEILTLLRDRGSNFDVASRYELDKLFSIGGVSPDRVQLWQYDQKSK